MNGIQLRGTYDKRRPCRRKVGRVTPVRADFRESPSARRGLRALPTQHAVPASSFLIWPLFNGAIIGRPENCLSYQSDIFSDENKLRLIKLEWLEFPAASHEIEKLRAIAKANEAFRPDHVRGQRVCEIFETIAKESSIRAERERSELWLMFMFGRHDLFLSPDAKQ